MSTIDELLANAKVGTTRQATVVVLPVNQRHWLADNSPETVWAIAAHIMATDPTIHTGENNSANVGLFLTNRAAAVEERQAGAQRAVRASGPAKTVHFYANQNGFTGRSVWDRTPIVDVEDLTQLDIALGKLLAFKAGKFPMDDKALKALEAEIAKLSAPAPEPPPA